MVCCFSCKSSDHSQITFHSVLIRMYIHVPYRIILVLIVVYNMVRILTLFVHQSRDRIVSLFGIPPRDSFFPVTSDSFLVMTFHHRNHIV